VGSERARVVLPGGGGRDGASVVLRDGDDRLRGRIVESRRSASEHSEQSVQVMEGGSAFIRVGESRPLPSRQIVRTVVNGRVVEQVVDATTYVDAVSGFQVRPRLSGDIVTLEIHPQRESFDHRVPGAVHTQSVATTASGRLGEWIELGGLAEQRSEQGSALLGRSAGGGHDNRRVRVWVEELR
jgi:hypothetical protein